MQWKCRFLEVTFPLRLRERIQAPSNAHCARSEGPCPAPAARGSVDERGRQRLEIGRPSHDRNCSSGGFAASPRNRASAHGIAAPCCGDLIGLGNFLVVLDTTIANVSIPAIAGKPRGRRNRPNRRGCGPRCNSAAVATARSSAETGRRRHRGTETAATREPFSEISRFANGESRPAGSRQKWGFHEQGSRVGRIRP